jgi:cytochrome c-type biogenesis protein CcmE
LTPRAALTPRAPSARKRPNTRRRAWVGLGAVGAALGYLLYQGLGSATQYYLTADQALAKQASLGTQRFNLEGTVVQGTIAQKGATVDFVVENAGVRIPVVSTGSPPQLFQSCIPVVLQGHFQGSVYASDLIEVKHSSTYVASHPGRVQPDAACHESQQ